MLVGFIFVQILTLKMKYRVVVPYHRKLYCVVNGSCEYNYLLLFLYFIPEAIVKNHIITHHSLHRCENFACLIVLSVCFCSNVSYECD